MDTQDISTSKRHTSLWNLHTRKCLLSGTLILVPFVVTLAVVGWLFGWIRRLLLPVVNVLFKTLSTLPDVGKIDPVYLKVFHRPANGSSRRRGSTGRRWQTIQAAPAPSECT